MHSIALPVRGDLSFRACCRGNGRGYCRFRRARILAYLAWQRWPSAKVHLQRCLSPTWWFMQVCRHVRYKWWCLRVGPIVHRRGIWIGRDQWCICINGIMDMCDWSKSYCERLLACVSESHTVWYSFRMILSNFFQTPFEISPISDQNKEFIISKLVNLDHVSDILWEATVPIVLLPQIRGADKRFVSLSCP